jgi:hypothetical protein
VDGCLVLGRYAVLHDAPAARVAAAAAHRRPWLAQRASWEVRGVAKRLAGSRYPRVRARLLAGRGAGRSAT